MRVVAADSLCIVILDYSYRTLQRPFGPTGQFGVTASVTRQRAGQENVRQLSATEREKKAATAHALRSTCKVRIAGEELSGIGSPMCYRFNITCTPQSHSLLLLLLSCPSHNFSPLAGACLSPLCHCGQVVSRAGLV